MPKIEISQKAFDYLQSNAAPLVDTTISVLDRIVDQHMQSMTQPSDAKSGMLMNFGASNLPSVKFTTISAAKIGSKPVIKRYWNDLIEYMVDACIKHGANREAILEVLLANTLSRKPNDEETKRGYRYIESADISFQGLEANRACRNIVSLAEQFSISVEVSIKWSLDEKAEYPGKQATLIFP